MTNRLAPRPRDHPGHAIESSWFIMREAEQRQDKTLPKAALEILDANLERGRDPQYAASSISSTSRAGRLINWSGIRLRRPHAEALYATLYTHYLTGEANYLAWFERIHAWTFSHLPVPGITPVVRLLHRDGSVPLPLKGNNWKGFFHVPGRSCRRSSCSKRCWPRIESAIDLRGLRGRNHFFRGNPMIVTVSPTWSTRPRMTPALEKAWHSSITAGWTVPDSRIEIDGECAFALVQSYETQTGAWLSRVTANTSISIRRLRGGSDRLAFIDRRRSPRPTTRRRTPGRAPCAEVEIMPCAWRPAIGRARPHRRRRAEACGRRAMAVKKIVVKVAV